MHRVSTRKHPLVKSGNILLDINYGVILNILGCTVATGLVNRPNVLKFSAKNIRTDDFIPPKSLSFKGKRCCAFTFD